MISFFKSTMQWFFCIAWEYQIIIYFFFQPGSLWIPTIFPCRSHFIIVTRSQYGLEFLFRVEIDRIQIRSSRQSDWIRKSEAACKSEFESLSKLHLKLKLKVSFFKSKLCAKRVCVSSSWKSSMIDPDWKKLIWNRREAIKDIYFFATFPWCLDAQDRVDEPPKLT